MLMSEAHNKLNTAVAQSGKAMAKDHTKVQNGSLSSHCHVCANGVRLCSIAGRTVTCIAKQK